jgi:hypothetical protein
MAAKKSFTVLFFLLNTEECYILVSKPQILSIIQNSKPFFFVETIKFNDLLYILKYKWVYVQNEMTDVERYMGGKRHHAESGRFRNNYRATRGRDQNIY